MLLVTALVRGLFHVPLRGSLLLLAFLTFLFLLTTLGLGLLVSTLVRTQQQAMGLCVFVLMVPMIYLSGLIFPVENMPRGFQIASYVIPVRYYANILRGIFLKGSGLDVLWPEALVAAGDRAGGADAGCAAVPEEFGVRRLTPGDLSARTLYELGQIYLCICRSCLTSLIVRNLPPKCRTAWQFGQTGRRSLTGSTKYS